MSANISSKIPFFFFFLLILSTVFLIRQSTHVLAGLEAFQVNMVNNLPDNTTPLVIHCQSRDDDLGIHRLCVDDEFHWRFRMNIFETTNFFCGFLWDTKNANFSVFYSSLAYAECGHRMKLNHCYWSVQQDGFYLSNVPNPPSERLKKMKSWQL